MLAAVLRQDVDWTALPADTPPRLRRLLERCLERDVKDRLRDIGEARVEIAKIESGAPDSAIVRPAAMLPHRERSREFFAWGVAGMVVLAVLAALAVGVPRATPVSAAASRVVRLPFVPAAGRTLSEVDDTVISPNGQLLLFSARGQDGRRVLWLRALDSLDAQPLPDTEDPIEPFWSPDSRSIAFGSAWKTEAARPGRGARANAHRRGALELGVVESVGRHRLQSRLSRRTDARGGDRGRTRPGDHARGGPRRRRGTSLSGVPARRASLSLLGAAGGQSGRPGLGEHEGVARRFRPGGLCATRLAALHPQRHRRGASIRRHSPRTLG